MKPIVWGLTVLVASLVWGCDGGETGGEGSSAQPSLGTQEHIHWQPAGTFAVPVYGVSCRFTADAVYTAASNNETDDSVTLELASDGSAVVHLRVHGAAGEVLVAENISMARGKKNESFRHAEGDPASPITWGDGLASQGAVIDGVLCFSDRLDEGEGRDAEFSLILQTSDGAHHAVGGSFLISDGVVTDSGIPETAVDVDLR